MARPTPDATALIVALLLTLLAAIEWWTRRRRATPPADTEPHPLLRPGLYAALAVVVGVRLLLGDLHVLGE
jgi:hypothetical protein